jgi:hypothetical protein
VSGGTIGRCMIHGGGLRCHYVGCSNGAVSGGKFGLCIIHGGGLRCHYVGCTNGAKSGGKFGMCGRHGGGVRCPLCVDHIDSRLGVQDYDVGGQLHCVRCFMFYFPKDPRWRPLHSQSKEMQVRNGLNVMYQGTDYNFIHDTPLWSNNCNCVHKRRIDHRLYLENTLLCIETDENAHKYYNQADEENRYHDFMMVHGGKLIFIRYNPDGKDAITGKPIAMEVSLKCLYKEIDRQIVRILEGKNSKILEIVKLFYPPPR